MFCDDGPVGAGLLDDALAVAEGSLLRRGTLIGEIASGGGEMPVND